MARTNANNPTSHFVTVVFALIIVATLYFAKAVFIPFALAILFAFLLTPIVRVLDRMHIPRTASSLIVVAAVVVILGSLSWAIAGQFVDIANQLPSYRWNIERKIGSLRGPKNQSIHNATAAVKEIGKEIISPATSGEGTLQPTVRSLAAGTAPVAKQPTPVQIVSSPASPFESLDTLVGPVSIFGLVVVFTLFMLIRREDLRNRFIRLVGHKHLNLMTQALDEASSRVSRYLLLQFTINVCYGFVIGIALYWIGVPHVLFWGTVAALLRFLPYVGFLMSAALPVMLSIAMFDGWTRPILVLAVYVGIELLVANLVEPFLLAANVGLSSLAILVAAVFWTVLWGPIGLVLSTPLTVCLVVVGRYVPDLRFLNILLGHEPVLAPASHFYQRLLASDQYEARAVLDKYLEGNSLLQLYDTVLVPALTLAEQDRHRSDLDEDTQQFVTLSTREIIEDLYERVSDPAPGTAFQATLGAESDEARSADGATAATTVFCVPARGDADETVAMMLAQLAEQAGFRSQCVPIGSPAEMVSALEKAQPDVIFISALQPFALSHARNLYFQVRTAVPSARVLIGLWGLSGETGKISRRLRVAAEDIISTSLEQALKTISPRLNHSADALARSA